MTAASYCSHISSFDSKVNPKTVLNEQDPTRNASTGTIPTLLRQLTFGVGAPRWSLRPQTRQQMLQTVLRARSAVTGFRTGPCTAKGRKVGTRYLVSKANLKGTNGWPEICSDSDSRKSGVSESCSEVVGQTRKKKIGEVTGFRSGTVLTGRSLAGDGASDESC